MFTKGDVPLKEIFKGYSKAEYNRASKVQYKATVTNLIVQLPSLHICKTIDGLR